MNRKILSRVLIVATGISILAMGCATDRQFLGVPIPPPGSKPPVITAYYAPEQGRFGDILRIYLAAEDPDQDMLQIGVRASQVGYGYYPTDWTFIKSEQYRGRFVGYLQWNTMSTHINFLPEWTQLTIKVSVIDEAGNESNEVSLPFVFFSGEHQVSPLPAPFNQRDLPRLGYIHLDLNDLFQMGDRNIYREK